MEPMITLTETTEIGWPRVKVRKGRILPRRCSCMGIEDVEANETSLYENISPNLKCLCVLFQTELCTPRHLVIL